MKQTSHKAGNKLVAIIVALVMVLGSAGYPRTAHAQWAVFDAANVIQNTLSAIFDGDISIKEYILDPLVTIAARTAIQSMMRSVINWANSGFQGSPAFVDDLRGNFRALGDAIADEFFNELGISGYINTPFRDALIRDLRMNYRRLTSDASFFLRNQYTLDQYSDNPDAFLRGDINRGGIRAWIHTWINPQNNPIGSYEEARRELEDRISRALGERTIQLNWSRGILSWCGDPPPPAEGEPVSLQPPARGCEPGQTVRTPGSFIHDRIEKALGSDIDAMVSADEIDEMIGAIFQGLVNKMLGGAGFSGLSSSSGGGGRSPVDEATDPSQAGGLSGSSRSISIISGQIDQIKQYQSNWQIIKDAAERAVELCGNRTSEEAEEARQALEDANAAIAKAAVAIARLNDILEDLSAPPGPDQTGRIREGTAAYEALQRENPPILPSPIEIATSGTNVQNNDQLNPPSLLMRLNSTIERLCVF
ncbi:hypothetical protein L0Y34_01960 [Candidatus Parcubacteria bacterium]|nr:hypothetical protein [Candidatus Parcubacteria bacterium]